MRLIQKIKKVYTIECATCGEEGELTATSKKKAAHKFTELGWTMSGEDAICPSCD